MKKVLLIIGLGIILLVGCSIKPLDELKFDTVVNDEKYVPVFSSPEDEYLRQLYTEFNLDQVIAGCTTDFEKVQKISHWVSNLWQHDGDNIPQKRDPLYILREVQKGERFRCVEYGIVINGCLTAVGIPSRVLYLKTKDVETRKSGAGHAVVEAYLADLDKWVFVDGQWDAIPVLNGTPLNAVEFQDALVHQKEGLSIITSKDLKNNQQYYNWVGEYLYYFDYTLDQRYPTPDFWQGVMLVPIGAKEPTVFQGKSAIQNMIYTHSIRAFYPKL